MAMMTTVLELEDHSISLQERRLFTLSMAIRGGEVATVMGASGSGKSSLLASIPGFLDPVFTAAGSIKLNGEDISAQPAIVRSADMLSAEKPTHVRAAGGGCG